MEKWPITVRFIPPNEGGRKTLPDTRDYRLVAWWDQAFRSCRLTSNGYEFGAWCHASIQFLVPVKELPEKFDLCEGARVVARARS